MGYRHHEHPHGHDHHHHEGLARHSIIPVDNGTISRISIPCFSRGDRTPWHDRPRHDHEGWPEPDSTDDSCQLPPRCYDQVLVLEEIDLVDVGYDSVEVSLLDPPDGLTATGSIDGGTVQLVIVAMCQDAEREDLDVPFAVYVLGTVTDDEDTERHLRDVVTKGIVHIERGPISDDSHWVDPTIEDRITEKVLEMVDPDVMTFEGSVSSEDDLVNHYLSKGSYYVVAEDGYYGGEGLHSGDIIFIVRDGIPTTSEELGFIISTTHQNVDTISNPEILDIMESE